MLIDNNRALQFNHATSMFLPRKSISHQNSNDENFNSITRLLNNAPKINREDLHIRFSRAWRNTIRSIVSTTTYQDVVDKFKDEIINREKITIKRPLNP